MSSATFISYVRVSTQAQGQSGLGLAAQLVAVENYVRGRGVLIGAVQEIESGRKGAKVALSFPGRWPIASGLEQPW